MSNKSTQKKAQTRHRNRKNTVAVGRVGQVFVSTMVVLGGLSGGIQALIGPVFPSVLSYATNVSHGGLLSSTNSQRTSNGLAPLTINSALNSAAQSKANDMVAKDYWSHTSPDGAQPWDFINSAGYSYSMAGENLAYGALTSESTVQAWMNSPGHRANILKSDFMEVGFGFANSPNYQGAGEQTVIVAMYAKPYVVPPAPAPTKPKPKPEPEPKPETKPPVKSAAKSDASRSADQTSKNELTKAPSGNLTRGREDDAPAESTTPEPPTAQAEAGGKEVIAPIMKTQPIKRFAVMTGNHSNIAVGIVSLIGMMVSAILLYRHSKAWHRSLSTGDQLIIRHPAIDIVAAIAIIVVVVLIQNVGHIL